MNPKPPGSSMRRTFVLTSLLLNASLAIGCSRQVSETKTHVTIGIQMSPAMALVMAAKDMGLFDKQGLDVELKPFTAGKFALQAFLGGSLDYAVAGEVPVTLSALQGNRFIVVAQVVERTTNEVRIVARKDKGITDARTYFAGHKRKLATSFGGGPEFFTFSFLRKYQIDSSAVEIISQKPEDMPAALLSGSVDAISIFDPFAFIAERQLGQNGVTFSDSTLYSELYVLVAPSTARPGGRGTIERILKALLDAQDRISTDPASAKAIVASYTKLEPAIIEGIWNNFVFAPALTHLLLDYQAAEVQWAKAKGTVGKDIPPPDFRAMIWEDPLRTVNPRAVRLP